MSVPFYKQKKDALEDVGITARQESHWRRSGLYEPEIGGGRFTEGDIKVLNFLRCLIVPEDKKGRKGLGLSVETVKRLLDERSTHKIVNESGDTEVLTPLVWLADSLDQFHHVRHIDFVRGELVTFEQVFSEYLSRVSRSGHFTLQTILTLAFDYLQTLHDSSGRDPRVYEAQRDSFFEKLRRLDLVTRAYVDEDYETFGYSPELTDDPWPEGFDKDPDDPRFNEVLQRLRQLQNEREVWKRRLARMAGEEDYDIAKVPF